MRGLYRVATLQDQVDTLREIVARELSGEDALRGGDNWFTSAEEVRNSLQEANAQLLNSIRTPDSLRTAIRDDSLWSRDSANLGGLLQALGKERIDALIDPPPTLDSTLLDLAARVRARRRAWDRTFAASAQTGPWHPIPPGDSLRFADDVDMRLARARREAASRREGLVAKTTIAERGRIVALALVSDFVQKELAARVNWIRKVALAFFLGGIAVLVAGLYRLERRHDLVVEASQRKIEKLEIAAEQVADEEPRDGEPHSVRKQIGELWREIEVEKDRVGREASRTAERRIGLKFGIAMLVLFAIPLAPRLEPEEIDLSGRFMPFSLSPWYAPSALPALVGRDARPTRRASTTDLMLGVGRIPPWSADSIAERVAARLASRDESFRQEVAGRLRLIDTVQAMIAADMSDRIANVSRALRSLPPPPPASEATP